MVLAHIGAPGSLHDMSAREFARRVNSQIGDKLHIEVLGNSVLGDDATHLDKLKNGKIELALLGTMMSSIDEVFAVFELPFLIRSRAHMNRVRAAIFDDTLQAAAKAKGYRLLALWEVGFRHITNSVRPIRYPEDLKGIRLRVPKTRWLTKAFETYGATVVNLRFDGVLSELQKGSIDGQETVMQLVYTSRIHEAQKYLSLTNHLYTPAFLVAREEQFNKLPPDAQSSIVKTAREIEKWSQDTGEQQDRIFLAKVRERLQVNDADLIEFYHVAAKSVYRDFSMTVPKGGELIKKIEALASSGK